MSSPQQTAARSRTELKRAVTQHQKRSSRHVEVENLAGDERML